jgi:ABC-type dipeptide/oligopeptide/nickel transport system ATPase subunit
LLDRGQGRLEDEPLAMSALLEVEGLSVGFRTRRGVVQALSQASLTVQPGELLLVVGESGSGKTVLAHTLLRLLPRNVNVSGSVRLGGEELLELAPNELRRVRGRRMALIPQSPASSLNPVRKLGDQLLEAAQARGLSEEEARKRLRGLLTELGLDLEFISGRYVHQLSGGMQQRIVNAMALVGEPDVVIADEPTSGLDADLVDTTAAQLRRSRRAVRRCSSSRTTCAWPSGSAAGWRCSTQAGSSNSVRRRRSSRRPRTPMDVSCCERCQSARANRPRARTGAHNTACPLRLRRPLPRPLRPLHRLDSRPLPGAGRRLGTLLRPC